MIGHRLAGFALEVAVLDVHGQDSGADQHYGRDDLAAAAAPSLVFIGYITVRKCSECLP